MPEMTGIEPGSAAPEGSAPKIRLRGRYRILIIIAVLGLIVVFIFPLIFPPEVEAPAPSQYGNPLSMAVEIANRNVTPLADVDYSCEIAKLTLASGQAVENARVLVRGSVRRIPAHRAALARCEAAFIATAPLQAAEYNLTVNYRIYPWRLRRTRQYRIAAQINGKGEIAGWKVN